MDGMGTGGYDCITIPGDIFIYFWHSHIMPNGMTIQSDIFILFWHSHILPNGMTIPGDIIISFLALSYFAKKHDNSRRQLFGVAFIFCQIALTVNLKTSFSVG